MEDKNITSNQFDNTNALSDFQNLQNSLNRPCPSCGYCPTCGRPQQRWYPYYGYQPYYYMTTTANIQ